MMQQPPVGQGLPTVKPSPHPKPQHSVGLLWANDQPYAETSDNTQHSQEKDMQTHNSSKRAATDPHFRHCELAFRVWITHSSLYIHTWQLMTYTVPSVLALFGRL